MSNARGTTDSQAHTLEEHALEKRALEERIIELETRLSFQERTMLELNDALAQLRLETARNADFLRRVLEELKLHRGDLMADPAEEPPPPHY